jgi:hypothetical protein
MAEALRAGYSTKKTMQEDFVVAERTLCFRVTIHMIKSVYVVLYKALSELLVDYQVTDG